MSAFEFRHGELFAEEVAAAEIAARFGTPCYVYSRRALESVFNRYRQALAGCEHRICYAVKANSNLAVLDVLARLGSGFDVVSGGEMERVVAAGGDPAGIVFSGVGKSPAEMRRGLELGIHCFNLESAAEMEMLDRVAGEFGAAAPVSLRVNPDVDARTHPYVSTGLRENKFGVTMDRALELYRRAADLPHLRVTGMDCHIGSQLTELGPFLDALRRLLALADRLQAEGIRLEHLDLGGGLGVRYRDEEPPSIDDYVAALRGELDGRDLTLVLEPGRSISANAGILLTRVRYLKPAETHNFALVDAGMNDLLRPALYQSWMDIRPAREGAGGTETEWDVVGPVCESADFLGRGRRLGLSPGDLLAVFGAGAYGFSMSSNYNSRCRAAEVMVDGGRAHLVRERETFADLIRGEHRLPV